MCQPFIRAWALLLILSFVIDPVTAAGMSSAAAPGFLRRGVRVDAFSIEAITPEPSISQPKIISLGLAGGPGLRHQAWELSQAAEKQALAWRALFSTVAGLCVIGTAAILSGHSVWASALWASVGIFGSLVWPPHPREPKIPIQPVHVPYTPKANRARSTEAPIWQLAYGDLWAAEVAEAMAAYIEPGDILVPLPGLFNRLLAQALAYRTGAPIHDAIRNEMPLTDDARREFGIPEALGTLSRKQVHPAHVVFLDMDDEPRIGVLREAYRTVGGGRALVYAGVQIVMHAQDPKWYFSSNQQVGLATILNAVLQLTARDGTLSFAVEDLIDPQTTIHRLYSLQSSIENKLNGLWKQGFFNREPTSMSGAHHQQMAFNYYFKTRIWQRLQNPNTLQDVYAHSRLETVIPKETGADVRDVLLALLHLGRKDRSQSISATDITKRVGGLSDADAQRILGLFEQAGLLMQHHLTANVVQRGVELFHAEERRYRWRSPELLERPDRDPKFESAIRETTAAMSQRKKRNTWSINEGFSTVGMLMQLSGVLVLIATLFWGMHQRFLLGSASLFTALGVSLAWMLISYSEASPEQEAAGWNGQRWRKIVRALRGQLETDEIDPVFTFILNRTVLMGGFGTLNLLLLGLQGRLITPESWVWLIWSGISAWVLSRMIRIDPRFNSQTARQRYSVESVIDGSFLKLEAQPPVDPAVSQFLMAIVSERARHPEEPGYEPLRALFAQLTFKQRLAVMQNLIWVSDWPEIVDFLAEVLNAKDGIGLALKTDLLKSIEYDLTGYTMQALHHVIDQMSLWHAIDLESLMREAGSQLPLRQQLHALAKSAAFEARIRQLRASGMPELQRHAELREVYAERIAFYALAGTLIPSVLTQIDQLFFNLEEAKRAVANPRVPRSELPHIDELIRSDVETFMAHLDNSYAAAVKDFPIYAFWQSHYLLTLGASYVEYLQLRSNPRVAFIEAWLTTHTGRRFALKTHWLKTLGFLPLEPDDLPSPLGSNRGFSVNALLIGMLPVVSGLMLIIKLIAGSAGGVLPASHTPRQNPAALHAA